MADSLTTRRASKPLGQRLIVLYRLVPWWLRVSLAYVLARAVTGWLLMGFAARQTSNSFTLAHPGYLSFASIWDGAWYRVIAASGYPSTLPVDAAGHVTENAWAFMPAYPFLVRALQELTGATFESVAIAVSFLFGWAATLLFRSLLGRFLPSGTATFATVLFAVAPVSAMFQVAYAESMGMFLLVLALWLLVHRRFWLMIPVVTVLGFTRPTGLGLALVMAAYLLVRWYRPGALLSHGTISRHLPASDPDVHPSTGRTRLRALVAPAVVMVVSGVVGFAWPIIAWIVTGVPKAYTDTELAWRSSYIGWGELVPFAAWFQGFGWWFHQPAGTILLVLVILSFAGFLLMPPARAVGVELRLWCAAYFVYLLAVFFPQSSTWRILMPLAPMLGIVALPRSPVYRIALVVLSVLLQWVWMYFCWWVNGYDWTPP